MGVFVVVGCPSFCRSGFGDICGGLYTLWPSPLHAPLRSFLQWGFRGAGRAETPAGAF
ncbi:unnamed protein product [Rhodiola kirilowii]